MRKDSPYLIPFYIPHKGCKHRCIYCNALISSYGEHEELTKNSFEKRVEEYLKTRNERGASVEICFYGGSFNNISKPERMKYLSFVNPYLKSGKVDSVRVSLRPDPLEGGLLDDLLRSKTEIIELGVQTMNDRVLAFLERDHTAMDVKKAVEKLKGRGFKVSVHVMAGLPKEDEAMFFASFGKILDLKPDFLRINPTLVLKETKLEKLFRSGEYKPLEMSNAVELCAKAYLLANGRGIKVLRMGMQSNELLDSSGVVAGPYHPSFGEFVISKVFLDKAGDLIKEKGLNKKDMIKIIVNPLSLSKMSGNKGMNISRLKSLFAIGEIKIASDPSLGEDKIDIV